MNSEQLVPSLMMMTIGIVLVAAVIGFLLFLRKRSNRAAAGRALSGE